MKNENIMKINMQFETLEHVFISKIGLPYVDSHVHNFIELVYFDVGDVIHTINDEKIIIEKGDMFLINPYMPHRYDKIGDGDVVVYNCCFQVGFLSNVLNLDIQDNFIDTLYFYFFKQALQDDNKKGYILIKDNIQYGFKNILDNMLNEFDKKKQGYLQILKSSLEILLVKSFRAFIQLQDQSCLFDSTAQCIQSIVTYIENNYKKEIKLNEISKLVFFSQTYLCRLFKKEKAMTMCQYISKLRIEEACRLLKNTKKSIESISIEVGYNDKKNFYEQFKKIKGITPSVYQSSSIC